MKIKKKEIKSLRNELKTHLKPLHSNIEIKKWYRNIIKESKLKLNLFHLQNVKIGNLTLKDKWFMIQDHFIK